MFVALDRVLESTASTGTGAVTLAGAVDGFIPFSSVGVGNSTWYCIEAVDDNGVPTGQWEVGTGIVGPGVISRDVVHASSNGGALVVFAAGLKRVFGNVPAHQLSKLINQSGINTGDQDLSGYLTISDAMAVFQPLDQDLTNIAALTPAGNAGKVIAVNAGGTAYTLATVSAGGGGDALQSLPLSQFAPTTSAQLAGVITNETGTGLLVFNNSPTLITPLGITKADVGLGNVDNTSDVNKPISNATQTALDGKQPLDAELTSISLLVPAGNAGKVITVNAGGTGFMLATVSGGGGGGDAMKADSLAQFAATTSLELAGVITDETGTGKLVFGTSPTITTPVGIVKGDVGLGNVDNTSDASKPVSTAQQTAINAAITTHEAAANPHPVYLTQPEGDSLYAAIGHTHAYQPLDPDLTNIAGLTITGNALKVIRVNAAANAYELATVSGGGGAASLVTIAQDNTTNANLSPVWAQTVGDVPLKITFGFHFNPFLGQLVTPDLVVGKIQGAVGSEGRIRLMSEPGGSQTDIRPSALPGAWTLRLPQSGGAANQILSTDGTGVSSWRNANNLVSMVNYVYGYNIEYINSQTTQIRIYSGQARDSTNTVSIEGSGAILDTSVNGAVNGNDSFQGAGTVSYNTTTGALTGTGGSGTAFLTAFGTRSMTGTITSTGTQINGTGSSRFMLEIRIGDLIGNAAKGFYRVTAIQDDATLTVQVAPSTPFTTGDLPSCVENPTIQVTGNVVTKIISITSDSAATTDTGAGTRTDQPYFIGRIYPTGNTHLSIYVVVSGFNAPGYVFSTQRITPFAKGFGGSPGLAGFNQYFRRVGTLTLGDGVIIPFSQYGMGHERWVTYEIPLSAYNTRILSNGSAIVWTPVSAGGCVPPTATMIAMAALVNNLAGGTIYLRKRNAGAPSPPAAATRPMKFTAPTTAFAGAPVYVPIDWAGYIDYAMSGASANGYLDVIGYLESL